MVGESYSLPRQLVAEGMGTGLLVATVVGSGIMADRLTPDDAVALLGNTVATGAILAVLIAVFGPISGAHFNPAVTLVFVVRRALPWAPGGGFVLAQLAGAVCGTWVAHLMFGLPVLQASQHVRSGPAQWFAEVVATFGLMVVILAGLRFRGAAIAWLVGLYITTAYWFTASTSFANPAVAVARSLTDTFSGIRPGDVPGFVAAEVMGALTGLALSTWLLQSVPAPTEASIFQTQATERT